MCEQDAWEQSIEQNVHDFGPDYEKSFGENQVLKKQKNKHCEKCNEENREFSEPG